MCFRQPTGLLALDNISFDIEEREIVAVVGGNGAGKTTLLEHLNGLLKPASGILKIFGRETRKQNVAELSRRVGLVFQNSDHQLFSRTVEEEVLFGLRNFFTEEAAAKRCEEAMAFFGFESLGSRVPLTLSGGEKKRLCIAAVMAWNPQMSWCWTSPRLGRTLKVGLGSSKRLKEPVAAQKTVIIVTHDLEFLWPLGARTVVMNRGRVVADVDPSLISGTSMFSTKQVSGNPSS